tara:strand:- start:250 stop:1230 length:981 start_codon:yes stop_codon:yes gene_type:complete
MKNLLALLLLIPSLSWGIDELDGYLLKDYKDAICNSGSPATYYFKKQNPKKWVLYMQPGGSASSDDSYRKRHRSLKISHLADDNKNKYKAFNILESFIENDYSIIYLPYCTSDVFSGAHNRTIDGHKIYFHGRIIVEAILEKFEKEFKQADDLIIGGSSAGSISVGINLKKIYEIGNPNTRFIHDGYWLDKTEIAQRKKLSNNKKVQYIMPNLPQDCMDWSDCFPSRERLSMYNFRDAFIVWTVDDHFRLAKNDKLMMESIKEDINFFGGGISLSKETPLLMGKRKSNHVILFQPSFYQDINGIKIKDIFENWLKKNDKSKILINF